MLNLAFCYTFTRKRPFLKSVDSSFLIAHSFAVNTYFCRGAVSPAKSKEAVEIQKMKKRARININALFFTVIRLLCKFQPLMLTSHRLALWFPIWHRMHRTFLKMPRPETAATKIKTAFKKTISTFTRKSAVAAIIFPGGPASLDPALSPTACRLFHCGTRISPLTLYTSFSTTPFNSGGSTIPLS